MKCNAAVNVTELEAMPCPGLARLTFQDFSNAKSSLSTLERPKVRLAIVRGSARSRAWSRRYTSGCRGQSRLLCLSSADSLVTSHVSFSSSQNAGSPAAETQCPEVTLGCGQLPSSSPLKCTGCFRRHPRLSPTDGSGEKLMQHG